jgi:uracil phosphoribosyltransferase
MAMEGARPTPMAGRAQPAREEVLGYPQLHVARHPLIATQLTLLRAAETGPARFRALLGEVSGLLGYEALADLPLVERVIETPLERTTGHELAQDVIVVPILRAGLAMVDGLLGWCRARASGTSASTATRPRSARCPTTTGR